MALEASELKNKLIELTKADFKVVESASLPTFLKDAKWIIQCSDMQNMNRTRHVNMIWKGTDDIIRVESMTLGDSAEWVEIDYGEEAVIDIHDQGSPDFSKQDIRAKFAHDFLTYERLQEYERIATEVSARRDVQVRIRFDRGKLITVFSMEARIDYRRSDPQQTIEAVLSNVKALKEALDEIDAYEGHRAKSLLN